MDLVDDALRAANDRLAALARDRLQALRAMERDLVDRAVDQGRDVVERAVHDVGRELAARDELQRALALVDGPARREAVDALVGRLRELGGDALDAAAPDGLVVGDVCLPCLERALRDAAKRGLQGGREQVERQLQRAAARVQKQVVKLAPEVLRRINDELGTRINFDALARFDGAQWLAARVLPAVNKGVLLATGVDLGQWSARDLREALKLPEALAARLDGYVGLVREKAAAALKELPLKIPREAADLLDRAVRRHVVDKVMTYWDERRPRGAPSFRELTSGQQTALFSQAWRQGVEAAKGAAERVYQQAAGSDPWRAVEAQLRGLPTLDRALRERLDAEADLLRDEWNRLGAPHR